MAADPRGKPSLPRVWLYVFSITVDESVLAKELAGAGGDRICVLTPHWLFPDERKRLTVGRSAVWEFRTFYDLLDVADMEYCDEAADQLILAVHGARDDRNDLVTDYYSTLTKLKNQRAAERLQANFEVEGGAVLSCDLGIVPEVWSAVGLVDRSVSSQVRPAGTWIKLRKMLTEPLAFHFLDHGGERWLLAGRPSRVGQYLDQGAVALQPLGRMSVAWLNFVMLAARKLDDTSRFGSLLWRVMNFPWRRCNPQVTRLAAAVHEHSVALAGLASVLRLEYINLQDSFLPEYYPSRYLLYRPQVCRFYVWDRFSRGIFNRHGLNSVVWGAYRSWTLPPIAPDAWRPVSRIVYLASGAGDWTALKNRSDEDLALALLIEVAKQRPDVTIYYRPHPLWLHPEHQGMNSIQRVITCVAEASVPNIMVSRGAKLDGRQFSLSGNLSAVSSSVDEDIAWADLVLGEHSQTMLVAALRGKVIAGINVSRHPPYFGDYARIGFPLVTSAEELIALIDRLQSPDCIHEFMDKYNQVIMRHNRENGAGRGGADVCVI